MTGPMQAIGGVLDGGVLCWGVKDSFLRYLAGTPGAHVSVGSGAGYTDTDEFAFPATPVDDTDGGMPDGTLRFAGDARFVGHGGLLHVELADPWIETAGPSATLSFLHTAAAGAAPVRVALARLRWDAPASPDDGHPWHEASAWLLPSGCEVFDGVYAPGEALAPVRVRKGP